MTVPRVKIRDISLHYEITGQGQPLVFIHGLGLSGREWERQVPCFSERYQVITFDVRGHGRSDKPPSPYNIELFATDTATLIEALAPVPAHVVGHSMGGMIAFQFAVSMPELIKSLVIVNSGPEFVVRTVVQRLEILRRLTIIRVMGMRKYGEFLSKRLFPLQEQKELRKLIAKHLAENSEKAYLNSFSALQGWSVEESLTDIRCPTLVIAADQDYTPVSYKEEYARRIPNAELAVIADSRHATPLDQPDRFNAVLADFLSKHE
jgi:3-oxoadipate enol-lactonase